MSHLRRLAFKKRNQPLLMDDLVPRGLVCNRPRVGRSSHYLRFNRTWPLIIGANKWTSGHPQKNWVQWLCEVLICETVLWYKSFRPENFRLQILDPQCLKVYTKQNGKKNDSKQDLRQGRGTQTHYWSIILIIVLKKTEDGLKKKKNNRKGLDDFKHQ